MPDRAFTMLEPQLRRIPSKPNRQTANPRNVLLYNTGVLNAPCA